MYVENSVLGKKKTNHPNCTDEETIAYKDIVTSSRYQSYMVAEWNNASGAISAHPVLFLSTRLLFSQHSCIFIKANDLH